MTDRPAKSLTMRLLPFLFPWLDSVMPRLHNTDLNNEQVSHNLKLDGKTVCSGRFASIVVTIVLFLGLLN